MGLSSLNGTFEKKNLVLPFYPDVMKLGRQTSSKTQPAPDNGFFDSRVLSRSHAEIWADYETGRVWIKDCKSSNGTYVNSLRLGDERSESEPHELNKNDTIELGIDISNEEGTGYVHRKISARVDRIAYMSLQAQNPGPQNPRQLQSNHDQQNGFAASKSRNQRPGNGIQRPQRAPAETLDMTLFGDMDASLEELSLANSRSTMHGIFMNSGVTSSATLERIVKKLASEIHEAKVESAKIHSVSKLLADINANQQESRLLSERLPALDSFKLQITTLTSQLEASKQELETKNMHIYELERLLAKSQEEPEVRPSSPEAIDRHGVPISLIHGALETDGPESHTTSHFSGIPLQSKGISEKDQESTTDTNQEKEPTTAKLANGSLSEDTKDITKVLAELEKTKKELSSYRKRAEAAELLALEHSKQIEHISNKESEHKHKPDDLQKSSRGDKHAGANGTETAFTSILTKVMHHNNAALNVPTAPMVAVLVAGLAMSYYFSKPYDT